MSNLIGKVLIGASKISESASTCFGNAANAANNFADTTKKKARVAMLRAEIDSLKARLADNVVVYGLSENNEKAASVLNEINEKLAQIEELEPTIVATEDNLKSCCKKKECECESSKNKCDDDCDCTCHNEESDGCDCNECTDAECDCECHEKDENKEDNK